jgi:hypothetical protein
MGVLPWSPLRHGQLSGKYVRDGGAPADSLRAGRTDGPSERDWSVIEAVARVAAEIGCGSAEVGARLGTQPAHNYLNTHRRVDNRTTPYEPGLAGDHPHS